MFDWYFLGSPLLMMFLYVAFLFYVLALPALILFVQIQILRRLDKIEHRLFDIR